MSKDMRTFSQPLSSMIACPDPTSSTGWSIHVLLADGRPALIRAVEPSDRERVEQLIRQARRDVSLAVQAQRAFKSVFSADQQPPNEATSDSIGLVSRGKIVGVATSRRREGVDDAGELAFVVDKEHRRLGGGTLLLECLIDRAAEAGLRRIEAVISSADQESMRVVKSLGLDIDEVRNGLAIELSIDLRTTERYLTLRDEREATAQIASITPILLPTSIAVVGAARSPEKIGHRILRQLLVGDFTGRLYAVNPNARSVCGLPAVAHLTDLPEPCDLVIVAVAARNVPSVLDDAVSAQSKAIVIVSSGFSETGELGACTEANLLRAARQGGLRVVGPNCLGVLNTDESVRMRAVFIDTEASEGQLALATQSGAVGIVMMEEALQAKVGISSFVSMGNKLDVSSNDLLCFLEANDHTRVIALYLESLGNPRKFARIARRVSKKKPIVALKAGHTTAGARSAKSHTGAAATSQAAVSALFQSCGVLEAHSLEELFDLSAVLLTDRLPLGDRVALVGNSGGPLILAADACEENGLIVEELPADAKRLLASIAPHSAATGNPVDLTADANASQLQEAIQVLLALDYVDALVLVVTALPAMSAQSARAALLQASSQCEKPIVGCIATPAGPVRAAERGFALLPSPERAARAMAALRDRMRWTLDSSAPTSAGPSPVTLPARELVQQALAIRPEGGWLDLDEAATLLRRCGLPVIQTIPTESGDDAARAAENLGFPVALKARSGEIVHKTERGGVHLNLTSSDAVRAAYEDLERCLGEAMRGAVVQPMATPGFEAIVGISRDRAFGPLVMLGVGGTLSDLIGDHAFGIPPFDTRSANRMVASLRSAPVFDGYRGHPPLDRNGLVTFTQRVSQIANDLEELAELDCNPVIVGPTGVIAVDCKVRLVHRLPGPGPLFPALRTPR